MPSIWSISDIDNKQSCCFRLYTFAHIKKKLTEIKGSADIYNFFHNKQGSLSTLVEYAIPLFQGLGASEVQFVLTITNKKYKKEKLLIFYAIKPNPKEENHFYFSGEFYHDEETK